MPKKVLGRILVLEELASIVQAIGVARLLALSLIVKILEDKYELTEMLFQPLTKELESGRHVPLLQASSANPEGAELPILMQKLCAD